jgi:two-component system, cell cycle sensor histidine kinase and response regulator CckA
LRPTPGRSTLFEASAVEESGEGILPRIPTAFWIVDRDLRITTAWGPGFDSLSLHPELDTIVGLDLFEYFKTDDPEFASIANHLRALDGKTIDCQSKLRGREAEVRLEPLRSHGEVIGVIGFALDVTEHRVLEDQAQRVQQIDSISALAGGIAHDLNNVLTAIAGFADLALSEVEAGSAVEAHLHQVTKASELGAAMTSRLMSFSRCDKPAPRRMNVDAVVVDLEVMLRAMIGARIRLVMDLDDELPEVSADPNQLRRLLVNLAVNARDAMPSGGVLTIETRHAQGEGVVEIHIRDTGTGMDEEVRAHLFEPFFTTKPAGKGTGLGLAAVQTIVTQCGGWIEVDTKPGEGTTFSIGLPTVEAA